MSEPPEAVAWLVLDEPGGARIALPDGTGGSVTIGRDPACEAQVPFDDNHVSRRHAQLTWAGPGEWSVIDLCSSNGTLVGGRRVLTPTPVRAGQYIQVGQTVYRIERADSAGPR
jgi:pSer/pThr/pTyr-binding forkhead associated (FHA) protein